MEHNVERYEVTRRMEMEVHGDGNEISECVIEFWIWIETMKAAREIWGVVIIHNSFIIVVKNKSFSTISIIFYVLRDNCNNGK